MRKLNENWIPEFHQSEGGVLECFETLLVLYSWRSHDVPRPAFVCAESSGHVGGAPRINKPKTLLQLTYVLRVVNEVGVISEEVYAGQVYLQLWMVEHLVCESYEDRSKV